MNQLRKDEIISKLISIFNDFEVDKTRQLFEPNMFWLISKYNQTNDNVELIDGNWVIANCPEPLKSLP